MASFAATLRWRTPCVALLCAGTSALISHKTCQYLTLFFKLDKALADDRNVSANNFTTTDIQA